MFPRSGDVELCERRGNLGTRPGHDHHDVCVAREHVNVSGKLGVSHFHTPELRTGLGAADLELLNDVRDSLKAVAIVVLGADTKTNTVKLQITQKDQ